MVKASLCKVLAVAVLASSSLATSSGCAAFASANAAHSHISPCVDSMAYSIFDLLLAGGATAIVVGVGAVDESPAWMLVPGVFVTSGVIGSIFVHRCRKSKESSGATLESSPAYQPVETKISDLPDATPEELGLPPPPEDPAKPAVRLELDPDYVTKNPPPPAGADAAGTAGKDAAGTEAGAAEDGAVGTTPSGEKWKPIACGTDMPASCPQGMRCMPFKDNRGYCVANP